MKAPADLDVRRAKGHGHEVAILSYALPRGSPKLTEAERDVLRLVLAGHTNARIARARKTSERTVANQVASIFKKVGVRSRSELAARRDLLLLA